MSDIWHTKRKKPKENKTIFAQHKSVLRGVDWFIWEPQEFTDATRADVIAWCYLDDLLALEAKLERTRNALDVAKLILKNLLPDLDGYERLDVEKALNEITALEQKEEK